MATKNNKKTNSYRKKAEKELNAKLLAKKCLTIEDIKLLSGLPEDRKGTTINIYKGPENFLQE